MRRILLIILIFALFPIYSNGQDTLKRSVFVPSHLKIQFAGNLGFVSAGIGYSFFHSNLWTSLYYGYVPRDIGGSNVNIYSLKLSYDFLNARVKQKYKVSTYLGMSLSYSGYIPIEVFPHVGAKFAFKQPNSFKGIDIFFEAGTTGLYLNYLVSNEHIKISEILNYSVGFTFFIDRFKN